MGARYTPATQQQRESSQAKRDIHTIHKLHTIHTIQQRENPAFLGAVRRIKNRCEQA